MALLMAVQPGPKCCCRRRSCCLPPLLLHLCRLPFCRHATAWNALQTRGTLLLQVPPGTIVRARGAAEDEAPLYELLRPGRVPVPHDASRQEQSTCQAPCQRFTSVKDPGELAFAMSPACQLTTVCAHRAGQRALVASGGRGGRGNLAFKSARNTAPALAEFGEKVRGGMRGGLGWLAGGGEMCRVDGGTGSAEQWMCRSAAYAEPA